MILRLPLRSAAHAGPIRRRPLASLPEELDEIGLQRVLVLCFARAGGHRRTRRPSPRGAPRRYARRCGDARTRGCR